MIRRSSLSIMLLALLAGSASAHGPGQGGAAAQRLVGAWRVDVAIGPCSLPEPAAFFSAYNTFHTGGTLSDFNWISPGFRAPGHGVWRHVGGRRYESRFQFFRYDLPAPATASGIQDVRVLISLDRDGNGYTGEVNAQQADLDGNPVGPPLCGEAVGTRLGL